MLDPLAYCVTNMYKQFKYLIWFRLKLDITKTPLKYHLLLRIDNIQLWLYCSNVNCLYLESRCIFQKMTAILNFGSHFGSYVNYYKSETFLLPNKTFVDILICVLHEIALCRWLKRFVSIQSRPSWN